MRVIRLDPESGDSYEGKVIPKQRPNNKLSVPLPRHDAIDYFFRIFRILEVLRDFRSFMSSLIPLSRGSFDVLVGMDRLSKMKFGIVCHEKVVRTPLEGDEILRVHGERAQRVVKTLMNTKSSKTKVSYDLVLFRREHQCHLLRRGAWSSFEVSVRITEEGEVVTYLRFITNFSKVVKPHTSPTERNQKYEWGTEREKAF
ncbi:hypothetical protein Tco_0867652 [Tanacetum coccineum]